MRRRWTLTAAIVVAVLAVLTSGNAPDPEQDLPPPQRRSSSSSSSSGYTHAVRRLSTRPSGATKRLATAVLARPCKDRRGAPSPPVGVVHTPPPPQIRVGLGAAQPASYPDTTGEYVQAALATQAQVFTARDVSRVSVVAGRVLSRCVRAWTRKPSPTSYSQDKLLDDDSRRPPPYVLRRLADLLDVLRKPPAKDILPQLSLSTAIAFVVDVAPDQTVIEFQYGRGRSDDLDPAMPSVSSLKTLLLHKTLIRKLLAQKPAADARRLGPRRPSGSSSSSSSSSSGGPSMW